MVKSEVKESIGVYVCGLKDVNLSEDKRLIRTHLYTVEVRLRDVQDDCRSR